MASEINELSTQLSSRNRWGAREKSRSRGISPEVSHRRREEVAGRKILDIRFPWADLDVPEFKKYRLHDTSFHYYLNNASENSWQLVGIE